MENGSLRDKRRSKELLWEALLVVHQREDDALDKDGNSGGEDNSVA